MCNYIFVLFLSNNHFFNFSEADCEIASLANELDAPVMGNDGDFYIFDIKHGYIPFQQYNFTGRNTRVKKFSFDGFVRHLAINPEMLPLLASLLGNDYISVPMLGRFSSHIQQLQSSSKLDAGSEKCKVIAQFLSKYESMSEACNAVISLYQNGAESPFGKALHLSIEEYQIKQSNLIGYFVSRSLGCNMCTYNGHSLPQWVVEMYREGLIAPEGLACLCNRQIFLRPQSEDVSLPSTQMCVKGLRWYYYELALNCEITTTVVPELPSQNKASTSNAATSNQIELEGDFDGILVEGFKAEVQGDIMGCNDLSPLSKISATEFQLPEGLASISNMTMYGQYERIPGFDPGAQEIQTQGDYKDTLSSVPGKAHIASTKMALTESKTDFHHTLQDKTTRHGTSTSTIYTKQDFDQTIINTLESEFAHKVSVENATKSEETGLPSTWDKSIKDCETDYPSESSSSLVKEGNSADDSIVVIEFDREGSTLARKEANLTPQTKPKIHDIRKMSDSAKKSHFLSLLHSDLPFIHGLPIKHQLVALALRYWVIHSQGLKPAHLAALLVHYVGEKQILYYPVTIQAVHGFSQWQNVLYWVERLNALFSFPFRTLEVASLYDGVRVCRLYQALQKKGQYFYISLSYRILSRVHKSNSRVFYVSCKGQLFKAGLALTLG